MFIVCKLNKHEKVASTCLLSKPYIIYIPRLHLPPVSEYGIIPYLLGWQYPSKIIVLTTIIYYDDSSDCLSDEW